MKKAYTNAVAQWTNNGKARSLESIQQPERIKELQDTFEHPKKWEELPEATKELLQLFVTELKRKKTYA